ncbi:hypothetical protein ABID82_002064 [Methylobacterium sp. PvP062]|jgi:hypothetical protein|uniref:Uncharacterized protein n=2 Tax=Methylobacterium radiotolerans TaxID=31998 RepID=B1M375_METRJ|nr:MULTISPECIES: hypothetical protein [Methylobacterium]MCX7332132.1 hypothetical protein [Hyphomicrobiales bacterium]GAN48375.1 hypothetical protein ME121_2392 [Methylobacterium sp. ME121]ACB24791.1 hypothetical protein Mrad2831_2807 [Methylobacterium radiotolerans JCM 2831]KIU32732.1 hypothetical protein SR39_14365 [Methylobacterium radiotolerans]KTS10908.1 hypothetical protein SB3_05605 [Methylobacterium radiotolerans]
MSHSPSPLCLAETGAVASVPSVAVRAYLALVAGLGGLVTAVMLMMSVAANSGNEAERISATQEDSYATTLVGALAVNLSKPLR